MDAVTRLAELLLRCGVQVPHDTRPRDFALDAIDSLVALDFLLSVERAFGLQLDTSELLAAGAFDTLGTLADFVVSRSPAS